MNSYHLAILEATSNGKFPELSDFWRNYHPTFVLSDSEYFYDDACRFSTTTQEEEGTGHGLQKILYVPVTRKVTDTDDSETANSPGKVILSSENNTQKLHSGINQE